MLTLNTLVEDQERFPSKKILNLFQKNCEELRPYCAPIFEFSKGFKNHLKNTILNSRTEGSMSGCEYSYQWNNELSSE